MFAMTDTPRESSPETTLEALAAPDAPVLLSENAEPPPSAAPPPEVPDAASPASAVKPKKDRFAQVAPVLEKLFELYPHLFGERFVPLKLGVFQELLAAHPSVFQRDMLKAALGVHTRSTRYLQCVADGMARHDLQGKPVEDMAPEHVFMAIVELHARRQARQAQDQTPKLARHMAQAYQNAGLSRNDYLARLPTLQEPIAQLLEEAMAQVDQQRARDAALVKAFEASGQTPQMFADALGMPLAEVRAVLKRRHPSP